MAIEIPLYRPAVFEAAADLSTKQFYFVKQTTTNNRINVCDTDGEYAIGVLLNKPSAAGDGATVEVGVGAIVKITAGETITAGDFVGTDSAGKAKIVEATNTGADVGDWILGQCIEGGAANEVITIKLGPTMRVEAV